MTRKLRKYKFWQPAKDDDGDSSGNSAVSYSKELGFCLWDTMGWDPDSYKSQELSFLLNGNLADRFDLTALNNNITGIFNQQVCGPDDGWLTYVLFNFHRMCNHHLSRTGQSTGNAFSCLTMFVCSVTGGEQGYFPPPVHIIRAKPAQA